jgi:predicted AlkP superfamily pyrophosphatase or phosphodiesterase
MRIRIPSYFWLPAALLAALIAAPSGAVQLERAHPERVHALLVLVSIDGLKPEAVLEAESRGLKVPNLRALVKDGAYATGVDGVLPTLTYPSHMTLLTGASPARHGIVANTTFDPYNRNETGWYWYAEDVHAETLWDAATAAHLKTANIYWPTSVGAPIDDNLPQIWRAGTEDDLKLQRALSTPGLEQALSASLGRYPGGMQETVAEDETRAQFAIRLLETRHPEFATFYFTGLDTEQHRSGPFSAASNAVLERLDAVVGSIRAAAEREAPGHTTFCVVSDHGFAAVEHDVNLYTAFLNAGLFSVDEQHKITSWKAMPWPTGGTSAIMLADPRDAIVRAQVSALLSQLASDPVNGIDRVLTREEITARGGFPDAAFVVAFRIGYESGVSRDGPLVSGPGNLGMHGYLPDRPEMRSAFFIVGPHIAAGLSLGEIDMRRIAPTLAHIMNLRLRDAELAALPIDDQPPAAR